MYGIFKRSTAIKHLHYITCPFAITGATIGVGITYPSGAPEFTPIFSVFVLLDLQFSVFVPLSMVFFLVIVLSVLFVFDLRLLITPLISSNFSLWLNTLKSDHNPYATDVSLCLDTHRQCESFQTSRQSPGCYLSFHYICQLLPLISRQSRHS